MAAEVYVGRDRLCAVRDESGRMAVSRRREECGSRIILFCGSFCVLMQGTQICILAAVDAGRETCMMRTESGAQHGVASTRE